MTCACGSDTLTSQRGPRLQKKKKKKKNCQKLGERHETDCLLKLSKWVEDERDVHEGKDIQPPMADSC